MGLNQSKGLPSEPIPEPQPEKEPSIRVEFHGNRSIIWDPYAPSLPPDTRASVPGRPNQDTEPSGTTSDPAKAPSSLEEVKELFTNYLGRRIAMWDTDSEYEVLPGRKGFGRCVEVAHLYAVLAIVHDPAAWFLPGKSYLQDCFKGKREPLVNWVHHEFSKGVNDMVVTIRRHARLCNVERQRNAAIGIFDDAILVERVTDDAGQGNNFCSQLDPKSPGTTETTTSGHLSNSPSPRERGELVEARDQVLQSYNSKCLVTGVRKPSQQVEGAHILDPEINKRLPDGTGTEAQRQRKRDFLCAFWRLGGLNSPYGNPIPEGHLDKVDPPCNIIPLSTEVRSLWDKNLFALRPIKHPTDPTHRLYLQTVWIKDCTTEGSHVRGGGCGGTPEEEKRNRMLSSAGVNHGDVYEIITSDPENCPLPSIMFLHVRYSNQRALAGMCATECLKQIFAGGPPELSGCYSGGPDRKRGISVDGNWGLRLHWMLTLLMRRLLSSGHALFSRTSICGIAENRSS